MLTSIICDGCKKEFERGQWAINKTRNFCSMECKRKAERTILKCGHCNSSFSIKNSLVSKYGADRKFCSRKCYIAWKKQVGRVTLICQQCGKKFSRQKWIPTKSYTCCSLKCQIDFQKKERVINPQGYVWIWVNDEKVLEHRFVMEQYLGRSLENNEIVHHVNQIRSDNRVENLAVMSPGEHTGIHNKLRVYTPQIRENMRQAQLKYFSDPIRSKKTRDAVSKANRKRV